MTPTKPPPAVSPKTPSLRSELTLAAVPTAAACARLFVRHALEQWGLGRLVEDAELIVSELVTNAVNATGPTTSEPTTFVTRINLALLAVRVVVLPTGLVVEVWDQEAKPPKRKNIADLDDFEDEGGRGLFIVESLAKRWSFYRPNGGGKWVWAELEIPRLSGSLPRRRRTGGSTVQPIEVETDVALMARVRDGLRRI